MFAKFCKNSKVVFSDFSMTINIVAPRAAKSLPIKLICCGSFNLVSSFISIAISLFVFLNRRNPINYLLCSHYFYPSQQFFTCSKNNLVENMNTNSPK